MAAFSLREALERGAVIVGVRAAEHGVGLSVELAPDADIVDGDERRIHQVVFNLLSNAVKFTPPGGHVTVASARVNGEVQVAVADTGPGIAAEDRERIFEQFQQTDVGVGQREGTGLGLALSRRLVELTAVGSGSRASQGKAAVSSSPSRRRRRNPWPANACS